MSTRTAEDEKRHLTQWANQVRTGGYQPVTPLGEPPQGEPLFARHGMPNVVSASTSPLFNNPPPGRTLGKPPLARQALGTYLAFLLDGNSMSHRASNTLYEDDAPFFHSSRSNLITGAGSALSAVSLATAIENVHGRCGWVPLYLIIPPALMLRAAQVLNSTICEWSANTDAPADDRQAPAPILRLVVCRELRDPRAWAVALSLETDSANPDAWVKCAGL